MKTFFFLTYSIFTNNFILLQDHGCSIPGRCLSASVSDEEFAVWEDKSTHPLESLWCVHLASEVHQDILFLPQLCLIFKLCHLLSMIYSNNVEYSKERQEQLA